MKILKMFIALLWLFLIAATPTPAPKYTGILTSVNCSSVQGTTNGIVEISLYLDGAFSKFATVTPTANPLIFTFNTTIPPTWKDGKNHVISARFTGTKTELSGSPTSLICAAPTPTPKPTPKPTPTPTATPKPTPIPTPVPTPTPTPIQYQGYLDQVSCAGFSGWASIVGDANTSVKVDVYIDSKLSTTVNANLSRPDLVQYGYGEFHGYNGTIPSSYFDGKSHIVETRISGSNFVLRLFSNNSFTCSNPTPTPTATPTPDTNGAISVAWDASPSKEVAGYLIQHGNASGVYTRTIDVGNVLGSIITSLDRSKTYYIIVLAYDADFNESGPSNEVSATPTSVASAKTRLAQMIKTNKVQKQNSH